MSISPVPVILQVANAEERTASKRPASPSVQPAPPAPPPEESPSPAIASLDQFTTNLKVDDEHQVYYQFVDNHTGRVLYEIPPETVREIVESHKVPQAVISKKHVLDVKS
jgi:hypothetical protein